MKEIMKQTEKTETKKNLTDAELQQVTGGIKDLSTARQECQAQSDRENCVKRDYCEWCEGKDGHYHCVMPI